MISAVRSAWALLLGIALIMLGNGLQGTLLGIRATLEGFSTGVTGLVMTGYFAGFLLGSTLAPKIVGQVGHIRVFAALASLASASALIYAIFVDPWVWGAMRLITGFSYAGLYVVAESWLNDRATNETRGQILSIYMIITLGGMAAGQFLLNVADPGGFGLFVLISVLVSVALVPISLTAAPAPAFDAPLPVGLRQLYRISPLGLIGIGGVGLAQGMVFGMGAVYARGAGLSIAETSLFMGLILLGGVALQWPIGWLSDIIDRRRVITAVTFAAAALAVVAAAVPDMPLPGLLVVACLFGGMNLPMYSLCNAHTNDFLEPAQVVGASSALVLVSGVGATFGPMLAAASITRLGPGGFFWMLGAVHAMIGLFALYRMVRRSAVPLEEQGVFVAIPARASPMAAALNPEAPGDAGDWENIPVGPTDE
ncbi:MAG: MFS transporter [Alphaproteobacteria bacterium]